MKEFSKWTIDEVEDYFRLTQTKEDAVLRAWLTADAAITPAEAEQLQRLGAKLQAHAHDWNEEELKLKFIGFVLALVDYDQAAYQAFFERRLALKIGQERLAGIIACVIAAGKHTPKRPFFCLHEYKPERHSANDPLAQTLVALAVAQRLNQDARPMYGAYVMGRIWYFVTLHDDVYAVSQAYDAAKDADLARIFMALRGIKMMIEQELQKHA
jgi:hypothetical protein